MERLRQNHLDHPSAAISKGIISSVGLNNKLQHLKTMAVTNQQIIEIVKNRKKCTCSSLDRRLQVSKSCGRVRKAIIPSPSIFKSFDMYIENVISITRCQMKEDARSGWESKLSAKYAKRALSCDNKKVLIKAIRLPDSSNSRRRQKTVIEHNELEFVSIGKQMTSYKVYSS